MFKRSRVSGRAEVDLGFMVSVGGSFVYNLFFWILEKRFRKKRGRKERRRGRLVMC